MQTFFDFTQPSRHICVYCHDHIGLLHAGIIAVEEVAKARRDILAGTRKVTHDQVSRQIAADLAAGRRHVDWHALHNSTPEQLSERAKRAVLDTTFEQRSERAKQAHRTRRRSRRQGDPP